MELWLVRHGESAWNRVRRFQGESDPGLSPEGVAQAEALAARLAGRGGPRVIYASPLRRARETAEVVARRLGVGVRVEPDLREIGLGAWEGMPVEEVVREYGDAYQRWLTAPLDHSPPGGEPLPALQARAVAALGAIAAAHPGGEVLVVTHGGVIAAYLCHLLGLSLNAIWRFRVQNASLSVVAPDPPGLLYTLSDTAHLVDGHLGARQ